MEPSRPSSTDPNAPYRHAIAALADNRIYGQQVQLDGEAHDEPGHNQANMLAGISPRRTNNRDRLNALAHNFDPSVAIAMQQIENSSTPTSTTEATTSSTSSITISTICHYLRKNANVYSTMAEGSIQNRLKSINISVETFLTALKEAYDADHPLWANLQVNHSERFELISRFIGIVTRPQGFHPSMRRAIQNSNNNPEQLIEKFIHYMLSLSR